jgi:hypothetical protein
VDVARQGQLAGAGAAYGVLGFENTYGAPFHSSSIVVTRSLGPEPAATASYTSPSPGPLVAHRFYCASVRTSSKMLMGEEVRMCHCVCCVGDGSRVVGELYTNMGTCVCT